MRILLASPLPAVGGTERQTLALAQLLLDKGHRVAVLGTPGPIWPQLEALRGFDHLGLDYLAADLSFVSLWRIVRDWQPHILHLQMARVWPKAYAAVRSLPKAKRPALLWHARGIKPSSYAPLTAALRMTGGWAVANCAAEHAKLLSFGMPGARCDWVANLVDTTPTVAQKQQGRMLIASRLSPERGIDQVLTACARLPQTGWLLDILGDGPQRQALEAQTQRLGIHNRVRFHGQVLDPAPWFARASLVINTPLMTQTFGAGHGNALIEGSLAGCALVSYDGSSAPELVQSGQTGWLVSTGDVAGLAQALQDAVLSPQRVERYGQAALALGRRLFDRDASYQRLLRLYTSALQETREKTCVS